jgi:hypothetical protein
MKRLLPFLFLAAITAAVPAHAAEGLLVTPNRVVFEGRTREVQVTLTNTGDEEGRFRLYFVNYRMTPQGQFEQVTTATSPTGELFAHDLVRYSPRSIVLPPGTTQVARLQLRLPANLPAGEYRSHLVFQSVPKPVEEKSSLKAQGKARAAITTLYGLSIPVIIRHGKTAAQVEIGDVKLVTGDDGKPYLNIALKRQGNASVFGDISVTQHKDSAKEPVAIGESNGLAVYTPLQERFVKIPLQEEVAAGLKKGKVRITYRSPSEDNRVLAEKVVDVR